MPGRPDFSTPGTGGSGQTVAVSNRPEIQKVTIEKTETLPSETLETVNFYAPSGSIYRLLAMELICDGIGGSTGFHEFKLRPQNLTLMKGKGDSTNRLAWQFNEWTGTSANDERPASTDAQVAAVNNAKGTETVPISFQYYNGADIDQTASRNYRILVAEESY